MFLNDQEVAEIAEWDDEQIEYIKEKVTEEGKLEDLKKGKPPEQVYLLPKFLAKYNIARCKVFWNSIAAASAGGPWWSCLSAGLGLNRRDVGWGCRSCCCMLCWGWTSRGRKVCIIQRVSFRDPYTGNKIYEFWKAYDKSQVLLSFSFDIGSQILVFFCSNTIKVVVYIKLCNLWKARGGTWWNPSIIQSWEILSLDY